MNNTFDAVFTQWIDELGVKVTKLPYAATLLNITRKIGFLPRFEQYPDAQRIPVIPAKAGIHLHPYRFLLSGMT